MNAKQTTLFGVVILAAVLALAGCGRDNLTSPALASTDAIVFDDDFGDGVDYQAFMGSKTDAVQMDFTEAFNGPASLRVTVPGPGATDGTFAGGAFTASVVRDLSGYNALTFYAKCSVDSSTLDVAGVANDNTGTSLYMSNRNAIPLSPEWTRIVIPIPNPSRLTLERGLFWFAEGHEYGEGFDMWFDEVRFEYIEGITNPRPFMGTRSQSTFVGGLVEIGGTGVTFDLGRADVDIECLPACLDYDSSDEEVATVTDGSVVAVGSGSATITCRLGEVEGEGTLTVNVLGAPEGPAPTPTVPAGDVISLFSDVYDDVNVDTWHAPWDGSTGEVVDFDIEGDNVKVYTDLNFAGITFEGDNLIDLTAAGMTHFHMDVWAPSGGRILIKLVDFGPNGTWDGPPADPFAELEFNGGTVPPFFNGQWSALEVPLSDFAAQGLTSMEHLAQMVISSTDVSTVIVDNVYFHR